jgi:hypothetical protein
LESFVVWRRLTHAGRVPSIPAEFNTIFNWIQPFPGAASRVSIKIIGGGNLAEAKGGALELENLYKGRLFPAS